MCNRAVLFLILFFFAEAMGAVAASETNTTPQDLFMKKVTTALYTFNWDAFIGLIYEDESLHNIVKPDYHFPARMWRDQRYSRTAELRKAREFDPPIELPGYYKGKKLEYVMPVEYWLVVCFSIKTEGGSLSSSSFYIPIGNVQDTLVIIPAAERERGGTDEPSTAPSTPTPHKNGDT